MSKPQTDSDRSALIRLASSLSVGSPYRRTLLAELTEDSSDGKDKRYKYPRTFHLPWSEGATSDDKILTSTDHFKGKRVVVTEKMDGENCTLGQNYTHARSTDSSSHSSRDWVKSFASQFQQDIPDGWRLCGENLYAKHSIFYEELPSYFLLFSIWDHRNVCLSWDETVEYASMLGVSTVPVLYDGIWDEDKISRLFDGRSKHGGKGEGYVVRSASEFSYSEFSKNIAKFVRANHVQTDAHWMQQKIVPNKIVKQGDFFLMASDRSALIRLASSLPKGSPERKAILAGVEKQSAKFGSILLELKQEKMQVLDTLLTKFRRDVPPLVKKRFAEKFPNWNIESNLTYTLEDKKGPFSGFETWLILDFIIAPKPSHPRYQTLDIGNIDDIHESWASADANEVHRINQWFQVVGFRTDLSSNGKTGPALRLSGNSRVSW